MANHSKPSPTVSLPQTRTQRRRWDTVWRLLGISLGVGLGLFLYVRWLSLPWSLGVQTNHEVRILEARRHGLHAENVSLSKRRSYLKSSEGIEALARSRGYHHPGEQVYLEPTPSIENKLSRR